LDHDQIAEGSLLVEQALTSRRFGPYLSSRDRPLQRPDADGCRTDGPVVRALRRAGAPILSLWSS